MTCRTGNQQGLGLASSPTYTYYKARYNLCSATAIAGAQLVPYATAERGEYRGGTQSLSNAHAGHENPMFQVIMQGSTQCGADYSGPLKYWIQGRME
jgi:hypothetical protein